MQVNILSELEMRNLCEKMRNSAVRPCVVQTEEQAAKMTANDPFSYEWHVGDEYYAFPMSVDGK